MSEPLDLKAVEVAFECARESGGPLVHCVHPFTLFDKNCGACRIARGGLVLITALRDTRARLQLHLEQHYIEGKPTCTCPLCGHDRIVLASVSDTEER
jgi:hypothetical protein